MSDVRSGSEKEWEARVQSLESKVSRLQDIAFGVQYKQEFLQAAFYDFIWKRSVGVDFSKAQIRRFLPVRIYIDDVRPEWETIGQRELLIKALWALLRAIKFYSVYELPEEKGSWKKFIGAISAWWGTEDDGKRRLEEIEAAAKNVLLNKPIAEIARTQAEAATAVIREIKGFEAATVSVGNMLLVVRTGPDGKKYLAAGALSDSALKRYEENLVEQIKPANAAQLLTESAGVAVVEVDKLQLPPPEEE